MVRLGRFESEHGNERLDGLGKVSAASVRRLGQPTDLFGREQPRVGILRSD